MKSLCTRTIGALAVILAAITLAVPTSAWAQATTLWISGGTAVDAVPQGTSGNTVLAQHGIGVAGGPIWVDGALNILSQKRVTLYDPGSESHWKNQIRFTSPTGSSLWDNDSHWRGTEGDFTNGPLPGQRAGSIVQGSGLARMEFWRIDSEPVVQTVVNGQSPMMMVSGYGYASIALAYLNDAYQIVIGPTDRILILLEDGGEDRDYDDYVGILMVTVTSPNVVSMTQAAASTAIVGAGLVVGTVTQQSSTSTPAGSVISQSPAAGTNVGQGTAVNLVVSTGPVTATVSVPSVVGLTQSAASTAIVNAGLVVGTVTQQSSSSVPAGSVISQSPGAGTTVTQGSAVNLVVSTGPAMVRVPKVVGLTQSAASTAIVNAGLVVGNISQVNSRAVPVGIVAGQSPSAGTLVAVGSKVALKVSIGSR